MRKYMLGLIIAVLFLISNASVAESLNGNIPEYDTYFDENMYDMPENPLYDYTDGIELRGGPPDDPTDPNKPTPLPGGLLVMLGFVGVYMLRYRKKNNSIDE